MYYFIGLESYVKGKNCCFYWEKYNWLFIWKFLDFLLYCYKDFRLVFDVKKYERVFNFFLSFFILF